MVKRARDSTTEGEDDPSTFKCAKFDDYMDRPKFYLHKCMIDSSLINYYNIGNLNQLGNKQASKSVINYLRSHESLFTEKTPCLYDHHHFNGPSYGVPSKWDNDTGEFTLWGKFCSLECVRAYIDNQSNRNRDRELELLAMVGRKIYGKFTRIEKAPSIYLIDTYGGPLSIDEFRSEFSSNRMWITNQIKGVHTNLVFDVYCNNDFFQYIKKTTKKDETLTPNVFSLRRERAPAHIPKRSLMTMLKKTDKDLNE